MVFIKHAPPLWPFGKFHFTKQEWILIQLDTQECNLVIYNFFPTEKQSLAKKKEKKGGGGLQREISQQNKLFLFGFISHEIFNLVPERNIFEILYVYFFLYPSLMKSTE